MYLLYDVKDLKVIAISKVQIYFQNVLHSFSFEDIEDIKLSNSKIFIFSKQNPYVGYLISNNLYRQMMLIISKKLIGAQM